ncbi:MAG: hypothetical protein JSR59_04085 [Proteobacteria bacterium]|nr:hypothetical protein [Pseudomonadota bacterium]
MSRLFTYVVRSDTGLAPNPFWGWCTLAVCTPNHQGSRVNPGDWVAGFLDKARGHRFLYAMEVEERIHRDAYFHDRRFARKKPRIDGTPRQRCGDNFYSLDASSAWQQHDTIYHKDARTSQQDISHPWVFAGRRFWYLGRDAQPIPAAFAALAGGRGARVTHPADVVEGFKAWVVANFATGIHALPRDIESAGVCGPSRPRQRDVCPPAPPCSPCR